jgi:hypothetical protein
MPSLSLFEWKDLVVRRRLKVPRFFLFLGIVSFTVCGCD